MHSEGFEQWFKLNKDLTHPFSGWSKAVTEIWRRTSEQNLEIIGENFSRLSDQLKRLSSVKKPEDLLNFQKECINENLTATIENVQKIMRLSMENFEEFTKLCGSSWREQASLATKFEKEREKRSK